MHEAGVTAVVGAAQYWDEKAVRALLNRDLVLFLAEQNIDVQSLEVMRGDDILGLTFTLSLRIKQEDLNDRIEVGRQLPADPKPKRRKK